MHHGMNSFGEDPDVFGRNGDPWQVIEQAKSTVSIDQTDQALILCNCLLDRDESIDRKIYIQALLVKARIVRSRFENKEARSLYQKALDICVNELGETAEETLEAREALFELKPRQQADWDLIFSVWEKLLLKIKRQAYDKKITAKQATKLFLMDAPVFLRVLYSLTDYMGMVEGDGFEEYFFAREPWEIEMTAQSFSPVGAQEESRLFASAKFAFDQGDDLSFFDENFRFENLTRLLALYLNEHASETKSVF